MSTTQTSKNDSKQQKWAQRHPILRALGLVALILLVFGCVLLFFVEQWLFDTWAALSVDEIIYHLSVSLEGADMTTVWKFIHSYLPFMLFVLIEIGVLLYIGFKRGGKYAVASVVSIVAVSIGLLGYALLDADKNIDLQTYLEGMASWQEGGEDFIGTNYIDPNDVEITFPQKKRNLIYIFLESMEMTYADEAAGGAFEENLIPELTMLAQQNEDFSGTDDALNGGHVFSGTDWTMGGMFAQTAGTPLKVPIAGGKLASQSAFFPGMTALGDLLAREGYHQELLLGSDATFGGRRSYFSTHGNYEFYDYIWAHESGYIPNDYYVFWGFEDQKLFALARMRLSELAQSDEPFNLTMLTLDTHFEDGYVCELCRDEFGSNQYANVMACSSRQVAEFVAWIQQQDFYEDTTIVISGDHVTMDYDFCDDVPEDYERRTYTAIINPATYVLHPTRVREYATFDMFPTTLAALGATIEGDRLGIGTNLFAGVPTLVEQIGRQACARELAKQSDFLSTLSKMDVDEEYMERAAEETTLDVKVLKASGRLNFYLGNLYYFDPGVIKNPTLVVTDTRTGEATAFDMKIVQPNPNDHNIYRCYAKTTFGEEDLPYLKAEVFVTVGMFKDYPLATREAEIDASASQATEEILDGNGAYVENSYESGYYEDSW